MSRRERAVWPAISAVAHVPIQVSSIVINRGEPFRGLTVGREHQKHRVRKGHVLLRRRAQEAEQVQALRPVTGRGHSEQISGALAASRSIELLPAALERPRGVRDDSEIVLGLAELSLDGGKVAEVLQLQ